MARAGNKQWWKKRSNLIAEWVFKQEANVPNDSTGDVEASYKTAVLWANYIFIIPTALGRKPVPLKSKKSKNTNRWQTHIYRKKPKIFKRKNFRNNKFKFKCIKIWNLISINAEREIKTSLVALHFKWTRSSRKVFWCANKTRRTRRKLKRRNTFLPFSHYCRLRSPQLLITLRYLFRTEWTRGREMSDYTLAITPAISFINSLSHSLCTEHWFRHGEVIISTDHYTHHPKKRSEKERRRWLRG